MYSRGLRKYSYPLSRHGNYQGFRDTNPLTASWLPDTQSVVIRRSALDTLSWSTDAQRTPKEKQYQVGPSIKANHSPQYVTRWWLWENLSSNTSLLSLLAMFEIYTRTRGDRFLIGHTVSPSTLSLQYFRPF